MGDSQHMFDTEKYLLFLRQIPILYYILIDEILLVTDNYLYIPISIYYLFLLHILIIGLLIMGYTYYYVKYSKRRTLVDNK